MKTPHQKTIYELVIEDKLLGRLTHEIMEKMKEDPNRYDLSPENCIRCLAISGYTITLVDPNEYDNVLESLINPDLQENVLYMPTLDGARAAFLAKNDGNETMYKLTYDDKDGKRYIGIIELQKHCISAGPKIL